MALPTSPVKIVIVHDDLTEKDPLVVELMVKYGKENVHFIKKSKDGLDYINNNLSEKMIVILDLNFKAGEPTGTQVFNDIRKKTSLVYIIIWTASDINDINREDLVQFINNDALAFESSTADYSRIIELVDNAAHQLEVRVDAVLENWIMKHPPEKRNQILLKTKEGKSYSMNDILESIRKQTPIGLDFEKNLLKLAIELFSRQKLKLDD